jgi:hypothetical protein
MSMITTIGHRIYHRDLHGVKFRFLYMAPCINVFLNEAVVVDDNWIGAIAVAVFRFIERNYQWVARHDIESLDVKEGDVVPWWSGSWWLHLPFRFANRFFRRVDLRQFE